MIMELKRETKTIFKLKEDEKEALEKAISVLIEIRDYLEENNLEISSCFEMIDDDILTENINRLDVILKANEDNTLIKDKE